MNNIAIFDGALVGATGACQERWITSKTAVSYLQFTLACNAFATEVDSLIGVDPLILVAECELMQSITQGVLANRFITDTNPTSYFDIASSVVALFNEQRLNLLPLPGGSVPIPIPLIDLAQTGAVLNQVMGWNGTQWAPQFTTAFAVTSFTHAPNLVLIGASVVSPAFTASYNRVATLVTLTDTEGNTDIIALPGTAFVSPHTFTKTVYGQTVTFTDTATDGTGSSAVNSSISWGQNVYFGSLADPGVYDAAFIQARTATLKLAPAGTYAFNATALQSCFFCTRTAFGLTPANFTVGGFPFACSKVATGVAVTNNGIPENFDVFRSDNMGLGAFNLVEA